MALSLHAYMQFVSRTSYATFANSGENRWCVLWA